MQLLASFAGKNGMHDFLLAKEIIDEVLAIVRKNGLSKVSNVSVNIGRIALAHDGFDEHIEDVDIDNLRFGLEKIASNTPLEDAAFDINKVQGHHWELTSIDGE